MTRKQVRSLEERMGSSASVAILSEVGYDTEFFNEGAYSNLLKLLSQEEQVDIILDGTLTAVNKPEILGEDLVYWCLEDEDAMKAAVDMTSSSKQYKKMRGIQLDTLEKRIVEIKKKVTNVRDIVLYFPSDDEQNGISAQINEMLLRRSKELRDTRGKLRGQSKELLDDYKAKGKEKAELAKQDDTHHQRSGLTKSMEYIEGRIEELKQKMLDVDQERQLYRENKSRPGHQFYTRKFMEKLLGKYQELADRQGIRLVTEQGTIDFGNGALRLDYAHSRHKTWAVTKGRAGALLGSTHGKLGGRGYRERKDAQAELLGDLKEAHKEGIDVLVESGHFGIGFKQLQKVSDHPDESNFRNQMSYDPNIAEDTISIVMAIPFEDQEKIARYITGKQPIRMSGGKPMSTRKHAVFDRANNSSVSGLTIIRKSIEGLISTEWIQYQNFKDGSVLKQPSSYAQIHVSSDEHLASPEENWMVRDGMMFQYKAALTKPTKLRGKDVYARGFISGGDTAEANSRRWTQRQHHSRDPKKVLEENIEMIVDLLKKPRGKTQDIVRDAVMKFTSDVRSGSVQSMYDILHWTANYYEEALDLTMEHSRLLHSLVFVTGNHADGVLSDLGLREGDFLRQRMHARGIPVFQVGEPGYCSTSLEEARVVSGGYQNARILNIPHYGATTKGNPLMDINLVIQHDPKGSGFTGLVGAARNADADLALAGHTHESWVKLDKSGHNEFRVANRVGTLQGVSPTEKAYASSVPRTQAGLRFSMPRPGHYIETALPAAYLRNKGREALAEKIADRLS